MQVQGDWMKGEWHAAGKSDADFGCIGIPGALGLPVTVDAWGLLGGVPADVEAAERDFAAVTVDPRVQAAFAIAKGSTPVRLDARGDIDSLLPFRARCARPARFRPAHPPSDRATRMDQHSVWDVAGAFWITPEMTPDQAAIAALRAVYGGA